jgi:hypothetical protein
MIRVERSLNILMEPAPPGPYIPSPEKAMAPIIPLTSTEDRVARDGLGRYIDRIYGKVNNKTNDPDLALTVVFNFLSRTPDILRQQVQNAISNLSTDGEPFSYYAPIITQTRLGYAARKEGKWPRGLAKDAVLRDLLRETLSFDDSIQETSRRWARLNAVNSRYYWLGQLEKTRNHPLVLEIISRIEESHELEDVVDNREV